MHFQIYINLFVPNFILLAECSIEQCSRINSNNNTLRITLQNNIIKKNRSVNLMTSGVKLNMRIRTQSSEEYSVQTRSNFDACDSTESLCFYDQSIILHIQTLQQIQIQKSEEVRKAFTSRSCNGSMLIVDEEVDLRKKTNSMINKEQPERTLTLPPHLYSKLVGFKRCINLAKNQLFNRAYGAIFGFIIGDSVGSHLIHQTYSTEKIIEALQMKPNRVFDLQAGLGTDETQILFSTVEGLIECRGIYDKNIMSKKYLQWLESNPFDISALLALSFSEIRSKKQQFGRIDFLHLGDDLIKGSVKNTKQESYIGLIRLIPLAIWGLHLSTIEFQVLIREEMKLITPNELVAETSIIYCQVLRCLLMTGDPMLAFYEASRWVYSKGSPKMMELWGCIENHNEMKMNNMNSNNVKFPFIYAMKELAEFESSRVDSKKEFIDILIKILSKGYNTDTNGSIVLGLVGAIVGYNNIPSYYKSIIQNVDHTSTHRHRNKSFPTNHLVQMVNQLIHQAPFALTIAS